MKCEPLKILISWVSASFLDQKSVMQKAHEAGSSVVEEETWKYNLEHLQVGGK